MSVKNNYNVIGVHQTGPISSACLVSNGKVIFASPEERFSRIKQDDSFPELTIKYILKEFNLNPDDINYFSIGWNPGENLSLKYRRNFSSNFRYPGDILSSVSNQILSNFYNKDIENSSLLFKERLSKGKGNIKIDFIDHHLSHLRLGIHSSGFNQGSALVIDGWSEQKTTSLYQFKNKNIKLLKSFKFPNSIGCFYSAITDYLGFRPLSDEWRVMGMSAYGDYKKVSKNFFNLIKNYKNGDYELNLDYFDFYNFDRQEWYSDKFIKEFGKPRKKNEKITQKHYDIAAATQKLFSDTITNILRHLYKITKNKNLVLSGGCAMNSVYNGTIKKLSKFENISISFAPDDSGNSIGAALETSLKNGQRLNNKNFSSYLGCKFSERYIKSQLDLYKIKYSKPKNLVEHVNQLLIKDQVVGIFRGRSEFGQRALGNRSILASPRNKIMKDKINKMIKFRENFRPFAPVIKISDLEKIFDTSDIGHVNYMEKVFKFKKKFYSICPAVVHKDYTGRLQTIDKNTNIFLYNLLNSFEEKTSCPVLLNTSLNTNNVPMVNSVNDALEVFYTSGLDAIVLESFVINKR